MTELRLPLERDTDMAKRARVFMAGHLAGVPAEVYGDVMLLTSELVSNVVAHGAEPAHLMTVIGPDSVRVLVHDSGTGTPAIRPPSADGVPSNGRGLVIVAALAREWGVVQLGDGLGKDVWFDLDLTSSLPVERLEATA